jgi:Ger(x)C family germination protein
MKRISQLGALCFLSVVLLSGCLGLKSMEDLTYVVAIGIDYDDEADEYTVYLQAVDFTNVAKQEGAAAGADTPNWIAKAKGKSLNHAVSKLYELSQPPLFFAHLKVVVLKEGAIEHKMKEIMRDLPRNRSIRHSIFLYGTKDSIEELFKQKALFNYPPVYSLLMNPADVVGDNYVLQPMRMREFIGQYYEPVGAAVIPSLYIAEKAWNRGGEAYPVLDIDGGYFFQNVQFKGFFKLEEVNGIKWMEEKSIQGTYLLGEKNNPHTVLGVTASQMDVKVETNEEGKPTFKVKASANIEILEELRNVSYSTMEEDIKTEIEKEIRGSFSKGLEKKADILRLGIPWYRYHQKEYQTFVKTASLDSYLEEDSLESVEVSVEMSTTNTYKFHIDQKPKEEK